MRILLCLSAAGSALGGCSPEQAASPGGVAASSATAVLTDAAGRTRATAQLRDAGSDAPRLTVRATGMAPGRYGIHVHAVGRCEPPDFASAGPHWNPTDRQHGTENPAGSHAGDLPNLVIGSNGTGVLEARLPATAMPLDADGAALIIHAAADDYRTDPSGNSGARVACGVIART